MEADYRTEAWIQWCPGCGNYGILLALRKAVSELKIPPEKLVIVSGIGCSSRIVYYIRGNNVHTIHGRAIPVASGIKLANPELEVVVVGGDGDLLSIGAGHFLALGRRNLDVAVILSDNSVYGLTKGQAGPTLPYSVKTKALPYPNIHERIDPVDIAIAAGYTFVARAYAYHVEKTKDLVKEAIVHRGSSFVQVIQPCPTYNDKMTPKSIESKISYEPQEGKIFLGVIYKIERETFEERIEKITPGYLKNPPSKRS